LLVLKGDSRSLMTLMRIAEQTGEFADDEKKFDAITIQIVD
jgi:hypothetical protein